MHLNFVPIYYLVTVFFYIIKLQLLMVISFRYDHDNNGVIVSAYVNKMMMVTMTKILIMFLMMMMAMMMVMKTIMVINIKARTI